MHIARQVPQRLHEHGQALAGLVAAEEEDGPPLARPGLDLGEPLDFDAVAEHLVATPQVLAGQGGSRLGNRVATREPPRSPAQRTSRPTVGGTGPGGVERTHQRGVGDQQGGETGPRHQRLVEVDDVEALVVQRPDGP